MKGSTLSIQRAILLAVLALIVGHSLAACGRLSPAPTDPGVNLGDPEVGGAAGIESGPETPVPLPTATREGSPRLDATAAATLTFPPTPTPEPTVDSRPPTAVPTAEAQLEASASPSATPMPPAATEVASEPTSTSTPAGERTHIVKAGENLYRIGLQYGLSWTAIAEYNGITDPNQISVGQELRIPPSPTATPTTTPTTTAGSGVTIAGNGAVTDDRPQTTTTKGSADSNGAAATEGESPAAVSGRPAAVVSVSPGETLYEISRRYGVSWEQIAEANGLETPNQIYAGQVLKIPPDVPGPPPAIAHQVHRGDTLSSLAQQYGLPLATLAEANGLAAPYTIFPGQTLVIPSEE